MRHSRRNGTIRWRWNHARQRVLAVFRSPAVLAAFSMSDALPWHGFQYAGDSDDGLWMQAEPRLWSCGEGFVDVVDMSAEPLRASRTFKRRRAQNVTVYSPT